MKTNHTPTPWQLDLEPIAPIDGSKLLISKDRGAIAEVTLNWIPRGMNEANAQFILTACNAQDDLVEALHKILHDPYSTCACAEVARAALRKAGVE